MADLEYMVADGIGDARSIPAADLTALRKKARNGGFRCLQAPEKLGGAGTRRVSAEPRPWLGLAATAPEHPVAWPAWRTSSSPGHRTGSGWRPRGS